MNKNLLFGCLAFSFLLAVAAVPGNRGMAGMAWANDDREANEILEAMPDDVPENFSDADIDELMKDIDEVDESIDVENKQDADALTPDQRARALADEIKQDPDLYRIQLQDESWLACA